MKECVFKACMAVFDNYLGGEGDRGQLPVGEDGCCERPGRAGR